MIIRAAVQQEYNKVLQFYYDIITDMQDMAYKPGWEKDVYPQKQFLYDSIIKGELFVALADQTIVSAMVVNHSFAEGYEKVKWTVAAEPGEVDIIHALGISASCQGQGIGKEMVGFAADLGTKKGSKAVRLDVLAENLPAQRLYLSMGFVYIDTIQLYYEDTGLTDFLLYELALPTENAKPY